MGSVAPATRGPVEGAATGVAKRDKEESTGSSESSKAPGTPAQTRHVAHRDGPAVSTGAGAQEAAAQAAARSAEGWSAPSRRAGVQEANNQRVGGPRVSRFM